ncbi:hypothetical protein A2397_00365 [Candidatus Amesbacteria bacterium RIFOXYB1_FULL_44_23]|uniref:Short-chain dehydrogenase n=1 Tax=Candidatus Amesbacteria bacterium RIFOXYB1_FULL_44_23 TaxID=1797263 RepID=A0A1F4ZU88_9BACT|nr:MAG: hypothetical protein A2397_00365 [Candidatus Amesbacteria bacterium RIFOXYB1_FULL_44_23]
MKNNHPKTLLKTAFITGANRGLGMGFVKYLSGQGYLVFAGARNLTSEHADTDSIKWVKIDVCDDMSIDAAVAKISEIVPNIDLLINNAGVSKDSATDNHKELVCNLKDLDRSMLLKMFNVNSISPLIVTQKFLHLLISKPCFVINISSGRGSYQDEYPNPIGNYGYRASKTALNMLTHCSTWDLPENVKTFSVHPGGIKTDMNPGGNDDPSVQAERIVEITQAWKEEYNGKFLRYNGVLYPL